jgi:hypothetical protein
MRRTCSALVLTAALALPLAVPPGAFAGTRAIGTIVVRVYDPYRHDYHRWDRGEEHSYREYLAARHRRYVAYQRQRAAERRAYWHWRHEREERLERERR